ncbi:MAG: thioredoxin fold domain-containing protein [Alphaproteobacteria bacterium]|nr:thioredoxin fold domain-containing protein [Alphaproteobacteria bacterium]
MNKNISIIPALALVFSSFAGIAEAQRGPRQDRHPYDSDRVRADYPNSNDVPVSQILAASNRKPVIVSFGADWCGPCHLFNADMRDLLEEEDPDPLNYYYIDIDQPHAQEIRTGLGVELRGYPTIFTVCHGEVVATAVGYTDEGRRAIATALDGPSCRY